MQVASVKWITRTHKTGDEERKCKEMGNQGVVDII